MRQTIGKIALLGLMLVSCGVLAEPPATRPAPDETAGPLLPRLALPPGARQVVIPMIRLTSYPVVPARINGEDAGLFLIDTGSYGTVVDTGLIGKLKLKPLGNTHMDALGGTGRASVVMVPAQEFSFGGVPAGPRILSGADFSNIKMILGRSITGIIGMDVLRELPFSIDFRQNTLTFYSQLPPEVALAAHKIPAKWSNGRPVLPARIEDVEGWFILDTGHGAFMDVSGAFLGIHPGVLKGKHLVRAIGFGGGGVIDSNRTEFDAIELAGRMFHQIPAYTAIRNKADPQAPFAGLLGHSFLFNSVLTIDAVSNAVYLRWLDPLPAAEAVKVIERDAAKDPEKTPLVLRALQCGQYDAARMLLERGEDPDAPGTANQRPLLLCTTRPELVKLLLSKGANPEERFAVRAESVLCRAAEFGRLDTVKALIAAKVDVNYRNTDGTAALHVAAEADFPEIIEALIAAGAQVNLRTRTGHTPVMKAAESGSAEAVEAMLKHKPDLELETEDGITALMYAATLGEPRICRRLLDAGADINHQGRRGHTAMIAAAQTGATGTIELLLRRGANPALRRGDRKTALDVAVEQNRPHSARMLYFGSEAATRPSPASR